MDTTEGQIMSEEGEGTTTSTNVGNTPVTEIPEATQILVREEMASQLHDSWREGRKLEDGTYEPRIKVNIRTEEGKEKWADADKIPPTATELKRQDIANTTYNELDEYWQRENRSAAGVVVEAMANSVKEGSPLDEKFVNEASVIVHNKWLERNSWVKDPQYGNPLLAKPFEELSKEEQDKDTAQVLLGMKVFTAINGKS